MEVSDGIIEEKHFAAEYLDWTKGLISNIRSTEKGLEDIRLRKGLAKQLMDELLPIGRFAHKHFEGSPEVFIKLKIGNQNYDATVDDQRVVRGSVKYIEVTTTNIVCASNGYEDYLFRHHLHNHGTSGTGNISAKGSKFKGLQTELHRDMVSQEYVLESEKQTIEGAINRKSDIKYPDNTALVISFDDLFAFDHTENILSIKSVLEANRLKLVNFCIVAIVGYHKDLYIEYHP